MKTKPFGSSLNATQKTQTVDSTLLQDFFLWQDWLNCIKNFLRRLNTISFLPK